MAEIKCRSITKQHLKKITGCLYPHNGKTMLHSWRRTVTDELLEKLGMTRKEFGNRQKFEFKEVEILKQYFKIEEKELQDI